MGRDIATFVQLATPHDAALAVDLMDGAAQRLRPIDDIALTVIALLPERMAGLVGVEFDLVVLGDAAALSFEPADTLSDLIESFLRTRFSIALRRAW